MNLRDYQQNAVNAVFEKYKSGAKSLLLVLPTGGGKTIVFCTIAKMWQGRVLIIAHREELITQACNKIWDITKEKPGVEMAGTKSSPGDRIVVASVATLSRPSRSIAGDQFGLVIIDEAHHAVANGYVSALQKFPRDLLIGVTATPWRSDKKNLSSLFEDVAYELNLIDLVRNGYLCDLRVKKIDVEIDISDVPTRAGDFAQQEVAKAVDPYINIIAKNVAKYYSDRKIIAFCPSIEISKQFVQECQSLGLLAEHVDGDSQDRSEILSRFRSNDIRILSNAQLLTEGYDQPDIDCVLMLSPTQSRVSYSQKIGRGTRIFDGKKELLVLDPHFRAKKDIIGPQDIVASDEREAKIIAKHLALGKTLLESFDCAKEDYRQWVSSRAKRYFGTGEKVSSVEYVAWALGNPDIANYEPTMAWHSHGPTWSQLKFIESAGINASFIKNKGMASIIIDTLINRRQKNLATFKQVKYLARNKIEDAPNMTFEKASAILDSVFSSRKGEKRERAQSN